ncbi:MAG: HU family DNA-binding protein [Pseudomonadota bacterium]
MAKNKITAFVAGKTKATKALVKKNVDYVFHYISSRLAKGQKLRIPGFGTFSVVERKARKGRHPKTGLSIKISARKAIKFKASAALRERLQKSKN